VSAKCCQKHAADKMAAVNIDTAHKGMLLGDFVKVPG